MWVARRRPIGRSAQPARTRDVGLHQPCLRNCPSGIEATAALQLRDARRSRADALRRGRRARCIFNVDTWPRPRRLPALILSPRTYNAKARLAIACPITSHVKGYPFEVPLPASGAVSGVVLADHVKNLDWHARRVTFEAKAPSDVVTDVRERLRVLLGL